MQCAHGDRRLPGLRPPRRHRASPPPAPRCASRSSAPSEYGLINAPFIPTEIFAFADAGAAWSSGQTPKSELQDHDTDERVPVFSVGVGLRILLSYIPIEVYAAKPFQRPDEEIVYGFNIMPGW